MAQSAEFILLLLRNLPDNRYSIGAYSRRSAHRDALTLDCPFPPSRTRLNCHKAAPMTAEPNAPGHNKQYYKEEEQLLIVLKQLGGLSWSEIALRFNESVPEDRHRTASALENKWRQIQKTHQ
ncbi:hypothetical protein N7537_009990 [Penicillium hordei]|uniref:Myb-like domain-containing protein n=1 Tax=Penicillium hordei TaxID=40994 RepID=A0AAD6GVA9_9EURO|nr:uncharacterized protein N7537_009990 [Penicillium hordei]KAJ5593086.1 hypothetical protein N7537_009990 [Penicillium hordei]